MKRALALLLALVSWSVHGDEGALGRAGSLLSAGMPEVAWERSTLISGDFNGDGHPDYAMVGYKNGQVVLGVRASSGKAGAYRNEFQSFGIGASLQAAICEAPAVLRVEEPSCRPMDEALPGCKASKRARSLNLSGGDCDPIHLYWDHTSNRMAWWRL